MSWAPDFAGQALPGSPFPLGASNVHGGIQFAVHAPDAERVQACLVDDAGEHRVDLRHQTYDIWHGIVDGVGGGQRYGYRAHGEWNPRRGLRMNPSKLLIDPSARRITGVVGDPQALLGYDGDPFGEPSAVDSLGHVPLSVVAAPSPSAGRKLETHWAETVIMATPEFANWLLA